ncbi:LPXTG-site transpeptidase family protein [hydrothermal vent metagenome]|uniref:LPXTG-site transpeptidase family protein n=1 Tax=hydrothermal vent metagenome TaxID=652676 RepID=A0A3B1ALB1_9ZZZZ
MLIKNKQHLFIVGIVLLASWQIVTGAYIQVKAYVAQQLLVSAWEQTLSGNKKVKPWSWADTWPIARLQVPALNEDMIILAGDSGRTLAFGPGYQFGSAQPGSLGVSIISAHRDTHFRFLKNIKGGDEIKIQTDKGETLVYQVTGMQVADKAAAQIDFDTTTSELVLVTCYPFNALQTGTRLRYLVYATEKNKTL